MCIVCFYWVLPAFNLAVLPDFNPILLSGPIPQLDYESIGLGAIDFHFPVLPPVIGISGLVSTVVSALNLPSE